MKNQTYAGIDLLRFLAAAMVCLYHLGYMTWATGDGVASRMAGGHYAYPEIAAASEVGWLGVQIFFMISGFVILCSAQVPAWTFLRSRILRLYPAVWVCAPLVLILSIGFGGYGVEEAPTRIVRSMLLLPKGNWVDGVYWTLGIEMCFYAMVFAMLAIGLARHLTLLLIVVGLASSSFWLALAAAKLFAPESHQAISALVLNLQRPLELSLVMHGCYFAIGGLLWAMRNGGNSRWAWGVVAICVAGALAEIEATAATKLAAPGEATLTVQAIWLLALAFMIASIHGREWLSRFADANAARQLGLMTYPLYLLHTAVGSATLMLCGGVGINRWSALLLAVAASIAASAVVVQRVEPRLRKSLATLVDGVAIRGSRFAILAKA